MSPLRCVTVLLMVFSLVLQGRCLPSHRRTCPEGWSTYGSSRNADGVYKCYKVVDYDDSLKDAEKKCALVGGVPASIHSTAENDFIA
ncbi:hypothetical protein AAVH_32753, partial [Aphelenchoides avenae]